MTGFIATVEKPSLLKIRGSNEKVTLDLFVNGRLRESNILKHIHTARIVESYLYGQIHYNDLDDETEYERTIKKVIGNLKNLFRINRDSLLLFGCIL